MQDPEAGIAALRERLQSGERGGSDAERELLLDLSDAMRLRASQFGDHRHLKMLRHATRMAEECDADLTAAVTDRDAAEDVVRWIHRTYDNEETNRDYRVALRQVGKLAGPGEDDSVPSALSWVSTTTSGDYDPSPDPSEMLDWEEDVRPMAEAAANNRDAALVAVAFDAGLRGGEITDLQVGDVSDSKHGLRLSVDGKQGQRSVVLIPSVPYLQQWLADHPGQEDPEAPLWSHLDEVEEPSYRLLNGVLTRLAEKAGVETKVTFTRLRKSSAAHLASKNMSQAHIEEHHGWTQGSSAASRYIAIFASEAERELAKVYGREVEEEDDDKLAPLQCPRCDKETPREKDLCVWCGQALAPGAADEVEEIEDMLVEAIATSDGDDAQRLIDLRDEIRRDPETLEDLRAEIAPLLDRLEG